MVDAVDRLDAAARPARAGEEPDRQVGAGAVEADRVEGALVELRQRAP